MYLNERKAYTNEHVC